MLISLDCLLRDAEVYQTTRFTPQMNAIIICQIK